MQHNSSSLFHLETASHDIHHQIQSLQILHQRDHAIQKQLSIQQQKETQQSLQGILSAQNCLQLRMDLFEAAAIARKAESVARTAPESFKTVPSSTLWTSLPQPANLNAVTLGPDCGIGCKCSCHVRRSIKLSSLHQFLGSLLVGYIGLPVITPKCDDYHCSRRAQLVTTITYFFPPWFLARAFYLAFRSSSNTGPELVIRVISVVPGSSAIFTSTVHGDLEGVSNLLTRSLGSPFDVHHESGMSALGVCQRFPSMIALFNMFDSTLCSTVGMRLLRSSSKLVQIHIRRTTAEGISPLDKP